MSDDVIEIIDVGPLACLVLRPDSTAVEGALETGLAWREGWQVHTRIWLLGALRAYGYVVRLAPAPGLKERLKAAADWFGATPAPVPRDYALRLPFKDHQMASTGLIAHTHGCLLCDEVGLGKTIASGTVVGRRLAEGGAAIIATTLSSTLQWSDELTKKIGACEHRHITTIPPGAAARREAITRWGKQGGILLIHHDALRIEADHIASTARTVSKNRPSLTFVFDEVSAIRNAETSKLWAAAMLIGSATTHRVGLTATAIENNLLDLWSIAEWALPGYFGPLKQFERRYIKMRRFFFAGEMRKKPVKYFNLPEIKRALRPIYLRRTATEVGLKLPEIRSETIVLDMSPAQKAFYDRIVARFKAGQLPGGAPAALTRLQVVCCDPTRFRGGGTSNPKLEALNSLVRGRFRNEQIVVFSRFARVIARAAEMMPDLRPLVISGDKTLGARQGAKATFAAGACRILLMTNAGERSLNLQTGGVLINLDLPWNPAAVRQRIGRIFRIGNEREYITLITILMRDTIESRVVQVLAQKQSLFDAVASPDPQTDEVRASIALTASKMMRLA